SYAATARAKSWSQKGADFISAMVFMFASTNLVIELGVVLLILMGWQFAAADFIASHLRHLSARRLFHRRSSLYHPVRRLRRVGPHPGSGGPSPPNRAPRTRWRSRPPRDGR